jgi:DNA-binding MarR family transcriptional regulator
VTIAPAQTGPAEEAPLPVPIEVRLDGLATWLLEEWISGAETAAAELLDWRSISRAELHPLRIAILECLSLDGGVGRRSATDLKEEIGAPLANVNYHLTELRDAGLAKLVESVPVRGSVERFYQLDPPSDQPDWGRVVAAHLHRYRIAILEALALGGGRVLSSSLLSTEFQVPIGNIHYHAGGLLESGCLVEVYSRRVRGATQHFYCLPAVARQVSIAGVPDVEIRPRRGETAAAPKQRSARSVRPGVALGPNAQPAGRRHRNGTDPGSDGRAPQGSNARLIVETVRSDPGVTPSEIAERTGLKRTIVSATIQRLKEKGELESADQPAPRSSDQDLVPASPRFITLGQSPGRDGRAPQGTVKRLIVEAVREKPGITATEIAEVTGVKRTTVSATIHRLKRLGTLESVGRDRSRVRLPDDGRPPSPRPVGRRPGRDGRAPQGTIKRLIVEAVREKPGITATEIAEVTGVKKDTAKATINRLRRSGELERRGDGSEIHLAGGG